VDVEEAMTRYDYGTVQDILRTVVATCSAAADDAARPEAERHQANATMAAAAAHLQKLRSAGDDEVDRIGRHYASILAALNR